MLSPDHPPQKLRLLIRKRSAKKRKRKRKWEVNVSDCGESDTVSLTSDCEFEHLHVVKKKQMMTMAAALRSQLTANSGLQTRGSRRWNCFTGRSEGRCSSVRRLSNWEIQLKLGSLELGKDLRWRDFDAEFARKGRLGRFWFCRASSAAEQDLQSGNFGFCLHDLMDQAGIETSFARVARTGFSEEVAKLAKQQVGEDEVLENGNLARAVLEIAAEDDALVSHSAVPLPVDMYLERLDSMANEFAGHHLPVQDRNPSAILEALDYYLYVYKGFQRTSRETSRDPRDFYLNGVLTRRLGTPVMLGLIYSEVVQRLKLQGAVEFVVQLQLPGSGDDRCWPRALIKKKEGASTSDEPTAEVRGGVPQTLLTSEVVLSKVLVSLKSLYWPWKPENGLSEERGFLDAAAAFSLGPVSSGSSSHGPFESLFTAPSKSRGSDVARARAAQYRLQRGIWTSTAFGDLRCALAASERLVILGIDRREHRDYGVLLFHCGLYEQAFQYLNSFSNSEASATTLQGSTEAKESVALKQLLDRLSLILAEKSWDSDSQPPQPIASPPEPW